jgi:radical SAM protein with 4Fe4S-binding SPASM domain
MLPAQIDTVIDQLMVLEVMNVHLSGCNPLLHLDLVKRVVERIRQQQRFPVGIVLHTNGIGLTPDFLDYAVENKIGFNFSLFATSADGYQPLSQNSAAFALVNTAMQQCQERQIPFITCVVLPPQAQETWLARKVHASQTGSQRVLFTEFISTLQPEPVTSVPVNEPRERTFNRDYFFFRKRSNVCLFGTLAIDAQLRLRPCPMITDCLGDLTQETIHDILQNKETMPYWNYTKRQVKVCQDCEFRYLCADCSMVEQETENQPELLKAICGYNPYTGCWPSQEHLSAEPAYVLEG